jgi:hypothetical protein
VAPYCSNFNVLFLGTLDILSVAAQKGFYDEVQCDRFIQTALKFNKASFPMGVTALRFYIPGDTSFI